MSQNILSADLVDRLKSAVLIPNGTLTSVFDAPDVFSVTFDDGPDLAVTPAVLDVLRGHDAKATFFMLTDHAMARPELVKRILDEGHEVGLHFDRHDRITELPRSAAFRRLSEARRQLESIAGPIWLFRPPYGSQNYLTYAFARLLGLKVVGWSRWADDWMEQTPESAAEIAYRNLRGGDIVLMHDGMEVEPGLPRPTFDRSRMVELFLAEATGRGLKAVTVGELLTRGAERRSHWFR